MKGRREGREIGFETRGRRREEEKWEYIPHDMDIFLKRIHV